MEPFRLTPKPYPRLPMERPSTTSMHPTTLDTGSGLDANDQYYQDMIDSNPDWKDYSDSQKKSIHAWLKGQAAMPDFIATGDLRHGTTPYSPSPLKTNPPIKPTGASAKVNSADVLANARTNPNQDVQDQITRQRLSKQLRNEKYNVSPVASDHWDIKGFTPDKMYQDQLQNAFNTPNSETNLALARSRNSSYQNNPYRPETNVPAGGDQATANSLRLLQAGVISPDQMPMIAKPTWSDDNAKRFGEAEYQGFYDSRQRQMMEGVDAVHGLSQSVASYGNNMADMVRDYVNRPPMQGPKLPSEKGTFSWEPEFKQARLNAARSMGNPVLTGRSPLNNVQVGPSQNYMPTGVLNLPSYTNNPRINQDQYAPPRDASSFPQTPNPFPYKRNPVRPKFTR